MDLDVQGHYVKRYTSRFEKLTAMVKVHDEESAEENGASVWRAFGVETDRKTRLRILFAFVYLSFACVM